MKNGTSRNSNFQETLPLSSTNRYAKSRSTKLFAAQYEELARTRLSKNFILRDFLFSTEAAALGLSNYPEHPELVIAAARSLCDKILEPVLERFGRFAIVFGYQCRQAIEAGMSKSERLNPRSSNPHMWDRQTWGDAVYSRVDILPYCVEDRLVTKSEFGHWVIQTLDVCLLMTWTRSNVFCITISPKPRRIWTEWGSPTLGEPRQNVLIGADYWQRIYPRLPEHERPKFGPSCTGGRIHFGERS